MCNVSFPIPRGMNVFKYDPSFSTTRLRQVGRLPTCRWQTAIFLVELYLIMSCQMFGIIKHSNNAESQVSIENKFGIKTERT